FLLLYYVNNRIIRSHDQLKRKYNKVSHSTRGWWNEINDSGASYLRYIDLERLTQLNQHLKFKGVVSVDLENAIIVMRDIKIEFEKFEDLPVFHEYDE
ncbi:hypothetical protein, partial [Mixta calida]|uniref:hypothetical protein n=1 Tax=Mixta calida TaxID=665913 RepID=UPI0034D5708D